MKILSLNLHCFKEEDRINKLDKIVKFIQDNDIDVCMFQEASQEIESNLLCDDIREGNNAYYIANKLGYNIYFHYIKHSFGYLEEGLAFVSKYPIENPNFKTISKTTNINDWFKRDVIKANINGITFFNTHLGWDAYGETGLEQIDVMMKEINKTVGAIVLAGDMNFADNSNEINYLKKHLYSCSDLAKINSSLNPTFHYDLDSNLKYDNQMIDFIFLNKKIENIHYEIVFNKEEDYVSDHSGIFVIL